MNGFQFGAGGTGTMSHQDLAALNVMLQKGLQAGYGAPAAAPGSGAALIPQSIEASLAVAEFDTRKEVRLFPRLHKPNIFATVHEYSRINRYGMDLDPFISETGLPPINSGAYARVFETVKYMCDVRRISDVMANVQVLGADSDTVALETRMGTAHLLGKIEHALFHADSRSNPQAFDGLKTIMERQSAGNISDMRGAVLTEERIRNDLAEAKETSYVAPEAIWTSYKSQQILGVLRGGNQRYNDTDGNSQITSGVTVKDVPTASGPVLIEPNVFLRVRRPNTAAIGDDAPNIAALGFNPGAGALAGAEVSRFAAADAGNYIYRLVAVGPTGKSAPLTSAPVAVAANQKVTITLDAAALATVTYFELYRTPVGGAAGTATFIQSIIRNDAGNTVITDFNEDLPGTTWAFALSYDPSILEFPRLLDLIRRPLPFFGLATVFAILLFGMPLSRTPSKLYAWKNVGQSA